MHNVTISIFGDQIFSEIITELKIFSKFKIKYYDNFDLWMKNVVGARQLAIFFRTNSDQNHLENIPKNSFPLIIINQSLPLQSIKSREFIEQINIPFRILDLEKKIISLLSKYKFNKDSLISLSSYIIDKNERKIKKNNIELQLTEKEINFLISFTKSKEPLSRNFVLKNVWHYSSESDTHTVETHIYRLRKKILQKFNDDNFIKNNEKGYYI